YDAVEPEHRLVAETLEQRWNAALAHVRALEARRAALATEAERHRPADPDSLLALAEEFPRVWASAATDIRTKKRVVRLLIEEIVAKAGPAPQPQIECLIHWQGGKHSQLVIPRNRTGHHRRCTDRAIVDVVRDLARSLADAGIARVLNRLGYRTGAGNSWTQHRVTSLRSSHRIPVFDRATDRPARLTIAAAAKRLGVSTATVRRMITLGLLPATQPTPYAPWAIQEDDLEREAVRRGAETVRNGGTLPRTTSTAQLALEESST
ncbi:MAG: helix-turn-helix domain-containing protein, partial [Candidatus Rokuibacteriota bacterium]